MNGQIQAAPETGSPRLGSSAPLPPSGSEAETRLGVQQKKLPNLGNFQVIHTTFPRPLLLNVKRQGITVPSGTLVYTFITFSDAVCSQNLPKCWMTYPETFPTMRSNFYALILVSKFVTNYFLWSVYRYSDGSLMVVSGVAIIFSLGGTVRAQWFYKAHC